MPQIHVDDSPLMDTANDSFQSLEERRRKGLSSQDGFSWNEFHGKSKPVNSLDGLWDALHAREEGIDPPFFVNQPES